MTKTCTKCKNSKDLDFFYGSKATKDGKQSWCKECQKTLNERKGYNRKYSLQSNYGITADQYDALLLKQGGTCLGCKRTVNQSTRNFNIDHDHSCCPGKKTCGKCIRGILCHGCNLILGHANDDPNTLRNLAEYLGYGSVGI